MVTEVEPKWKLASARHSNSCVLIVSYPEDTCELTRTRNPPIARWQRLKDSDQDSPSTVDDPQRFAQNERVHTSYVRLVNVWLLDIFQSLQ